MGNPIIQGWMRKKPMCFVSILLSHQVLHYGHTVKLTFLCCKMYIKTNPITLKLVLTHLTKGAFHLPQWQKGSTNERHCRAARCNNSPGCDKLHWHFLYLYAHQVACESWNDPQGSRWKYKRESSLPLLSRAVTDPTKNKILRVQGYHQLKMLHLYFDVRMSFGGNTQMLLRYCNR